MRALFVTLLILGVVTALCVTGRISGSSFVFRFMLYLDIFACAVVLNDADTTISSRCGLALLDPNGSKVLRGLGRVLNLMQKNHTTLAIADDIRRARLAIGRLER